MTRGLVDEDRVERIGNTPYELNARVFIFPKYPPESAPKAEWEVPGDGGLRRERLRGVFWGFHLREG